MTSEEIKQKPATDLSTNGWLKEIAYQLALSNEEKAIPELDPIAEKPVVAPERVKRTYTKRT